MALSFDAAYYLQTRPDVFQNFIGTAGKTGLTWEQFAQNHYNSYGRFEGANPNAVFNTLDYLTANPDVAKAGVNPFNHYLQYGANEDRSPNASFITFAAFSSTYAASYLAANPDLAAAGITTPAKLYAHFVVFGEFEGRAGAPVVDTGTPGKSFVLTTGVDSVVGTAGNDTITADNSDNTKIALTVADTINGGAGVDTLKIFSDGTAAGLAGLKASITNVETIYVNNANGQAIDVSGIAGVTSVIDDAPAATGTVTVKAQAVTFSNETAGGKTLTVASATTDTTQAVTVSKIGKDAATTDTIDFSGTKVASATLTSTGGANFVTLTNSAAGAPLATLTIKGDQALSLTESLATLKTIDASTSTGGVSVNAVGATIDTAFAFTGGTGADSIALKLGAIGLLKAGTQLDGGAGIDTLTLNDATFAAADYAKISAVKNFEILGFGASTTLDASQAVNFKEFAFSTGTDNLTNLQAGSTVDITGATTAVNLSAALGVSSVSINLGTATTAGFTTTSLTTTGMTNVTIKEAGTSAHTITALHNADNSNIVITGAADLTITAIDGTTTGSKIDASGVTGKFEVTGSGKADILIGGTAVDTLHTGGGADTLTGNAGLDKFDVALSLNSGSTIDSTITDMVKGETLQLAGVNGAAVFTTAAVSVAGAASLDAAVALAAAGDGGTNSQVKWFQFGGDTYVVEDNTNGVYAAATDEVVKLVGIHDLSASTLAVATLTHG